MTFHPERYAESLRDEAEAFEGCTEGDKVLIGLWMLADALVEIRLAIGPTDVVNVQKANLVEGILQAAEIIGEKVVVAVGR